MNPESGASSDPTSNQMRRTVFSARNCTATHRVEDSRIGSQVDECVVDGVRLGGGVVDGRASSLESIDGLLISTS